MKIAKVLLAVVFLVLGVFVLKNSDNMKTSTLTTPIFVKAIYSMPLTYDPIKMNDGAALIFSELVYEGLLRFTEDFGVQPALAKSWTTSDDGKIITFKLNPNAKFHNGEKVTALDVKISLSRNVSKESLVFKHYDVILGANDYFKKQTSEVIGLMVIDEETLEIHLEKPFPPLLYILAGATAKVFPAKLVNGKDFFRNPIAAGAFKIDKLGELKIDLTRYSEYHGQIPQIEKMTLFATDQDVAMTLAKQGKVHDLSAWPMNGSEEVFKDGRDIDSIVADTWIIGLNTRKIPFNSLENRKLFQQSIDSEKFRTTFYPDASPAFGYIPPSFPGYKEKLDQLEVINRKVPKDKITIYIPEELAKAKEMATFFENELRPKGWNVLVKTLKWETLMKGYNDKSLQSFLVSMIVDYPDSEFLLRNFESTNSDNFSGVEDKTVDELIAKSRVAQDRIARQNIYQELAKRVNDLSLSVNLFHSRAHYWVNKCVTGFKPNLLAVAYIDYRKVSFDQTCLMGGSLWAKK